MPSVSPSIDEGRRVGESFQSCLGQSCDGMRMIWGKLLMWRGGRERGRERDKKGGGEDVIKVMFKVA